MDWSLDAARRERLAALPMEKCFDGDFGYSSTYLAMGLANVRAGTQKRRASSTYLAFCARSYGAKDQTRFLELFPRGFETGCMVPVTGYLNTF